MQHWAKLKRDIWLRCGGRCENCGCALDRGAAHLHHLTYIRKGAELPRDVLYLCLGCHGSKHPRHTFMSTRLQKIIAAGRKKTRERTVRRAPHPPPPAPKDPAFDRVKEIMASRKLQRQNGGRMRARR